MSCRNSRLIQSILFARAHHGRSRRTRYLHKCRVDNKSDLHHLQYARSAELRRLDTQQSGKLIFRGRSRHLLLCRAKNKDKSRIKSTRAQSKT